MTVFSIKNKIFPLIGLLLAVTLSSFSGKGVVPTKEDLSISPQSSDSNKTKQSTEAETPQNQTSEEESDDKIEDVADPFMVEHFIATHINHQVNHIYEFQIALYREQHRVIFSPPPEA